MQYLSWADIQIPLCFVTGVSYAKRARTIAHTGGYVTARGLETSEISAQIQVTRAACMAYDLDFDQSVVLVRSLSAKKDNPSGCVTLGGYPLYPELQFALTNVNTTFSADSAAGVSVYACDIVLSGVTCSKEVCRTRALEFDPEDAIPCVALKCKDKKLLVQDGNQVSGLITSPDSCELECILGDDTQNASRKGFIDDFLKGNGLIEVDLPTGKAIYNATNSKLVGNVLSVSGSIFPEPSTQAVTVTYRDQSLKDIVSDLLTRCGCSDFSVKVDGQVDYFKTSDAPLTALEALQDSAGFVVNSRSNKVTVAWLPESIEGQKDLEGDVVEDGTREPIGRIVWNDGLHEFTAGEGSGEALQILSCFASSDDAFSKHCLACHRYHATYIALEAPIDKEIAHHSQINIHKDGTRVPCLVDYIQCDWVAGIARYDCKYLG